MASKPIRIGVGGPVGSGKTLLIERLLPLMLRDELSVVVITNDLVTKEDAERVKNGGLIDPDRVVGVETGACPHTAIREDPAQTNYMLSWRITLRMMVEGRCTCLVRTISFRESPIAL